MPRAGLDAATVTAAAAALADEVGLAELTMARVAERLGVRSPSLYKHVASQEDLQRRIAALAFDEVADAMGVAIQGRSGRDALGAAAHVLRRFVLEHPGRYAATVGLAPAGPDDPIAIAAMRGLPPLEAMLRGYDIGSGDMTHALRTVRSALHGFATLQAANGFQWVADVDTSFEWLIELLDRGLGGTVPSGVTTGRAATLPAAGEPEARPSQRPSTSVLPGEELREGQGDDLGSSGSRPVSGAVVGRPVGLDVPGVGEESPRPSDGCTRSADWRV